MWRKNSLSIVAASLFILALIGQAVSGWKTDNHERRDHKQPEISLGAFLRSADFGETVFENWESEFLQMAAYVLLTVFLRQKGSAESKKIDEKEESDEDPEKHRDDPNAPGPVKAGGWRLKLYKHSLGIALFVLFIASFTGHAITGARHYNEQQREHGSMESVTALGYLTSSHFWYESFQNWQSEFLAVLSIVVLSIWLREWGSPESKPVHAPHDRTGK